MKKLTKFTIKCVLRKQKELNKACVLTSYQDVLSTFKDIRMIC